MLKPGSMEVFPVIYGVLVATLPGPSRTIIVEPIRAPERPPAPEPAPDPQPAEEPVEVPA